MYVCLCVYILIIHAHTREYTTLARAHAHTRSSEKHTTAAARYYFCFCRYPLTAAPSVMMVSVAASSGSGLSACIVYYSSAVQAAAMATGGTHTRPRACALSHSLARLWPHGAHTDNRSRAYTLCAHTFDATKPRTRHPPRSSLYTHATVTCCHCDR